jgi:hypothetical protein
MKTRSISIDSISTHSSVSGEKTVTMNGRFAPQAADEKGQDGFDAMVFGSL